MPEPDARPQRADTTPPPAEVAIDEQVARAILATPGVVRLESPLTEVVRRLAMDTTRVLPGHRPPRPSGDTVKVTVRGRTAATVADLTISDERSALVTARAVRTTAEAALRAGLPDGTDVSVTVNILSIETPGVTPPTSA